METFSLAAVSLTIAISLLIKRKKDILHRSYAVLCLVLAAERGAFFLYGITADEFWRAFHAVGMVALAPLVVVFFRIFMGNRGEFLPRYGSWYVLAGGIAVGFLFFLLPESRAASNMLLYGYAGAATGWCLVALIRAALGGEGVRRKRLSYVAMAVTAWGLMSVSDILQLAGLATPSLAEIGAAILIYFVLIVIVYPRLPELYEIMARAVIIFMLILFVTGLFYAVTSIFGDAAAVPDFSLVLMASFIIVIFIDPVKLLLKRATSFFLFDGRTVFTSLFALDDEVEKEKSLFLEEMARGLAHEIRNPLGAIKGAAQYLKTGSDIEESEQLLGVITEEVDRLGNVVSRFLSYANPYVVNAKPQDMNALVERAVELIRRDDFPEGITVRTNLAPNLPPVPLDEEQFMQVIFNIVRNALEAMPRGGVLSLSSLLREGDGHGTGTVKLNIGDTGEGIGRDTIKHLFKPFFTTKKGGTGLGLAICRKIVNEHGGYIKVTSQKGKGTIFNIVFPLD